MHRSHGPTPRHRNLMPAVHDPALGMLTCACSHQPADLCMLVSGAGGGPVHGSAHTLPRRAQVALCCIYCAACLRRLPRMHLQEGHAAQGAAGGGGQGSGGAPEGGGPGGGRGGHCSRLQHLPPLCLHLTFPRGYPGSGPPEFRLSAVWLSVRGAARLAAGLKDLWDEQVTSQTP